MKKNYFTRLGEADLVNREHFPLMPVLWVVFFSRLNNIVRTLSQMHSHTSADIFLQTLQLNELSTQGHIATH
jgi:hypothetical protein